MLALEERTLPYPLRRSSTGLTHKHACTGDDEKESDKMKKNMLEMRPRLARRRQRPSASATRVLVRWARRARCCFVRALAEKLAAGVVAVSCQCLYQSKSC